MKVNSEKIKKDFGEHIRQLRESKNWTQERLAEEVGLHFTYIGQIERGLRNPSLVNIYKLSKALNVKKGEILHF